MALLWIGVVLIFPAIFAEPVRICVPESLSTSCSEMESDLPETFKCINAPDAFSCVKKVQEGEADVTNVNPAAFYLAGTLYGLHAIATETVDGEPYRYQSIALVRKESNIQSPEDLQNRSSCHTGLGRTAGWQIPLGRLLHASIMPANCEEGELAAVENFFNGSCVPGDWSADSIVNQELKSKYKGLCSRCKNPSTCAKDDEYAGYEGVMNCLSDGAADVAFTKIPALREYLEKNPSFSEKAEILCFEGGRKSVLDSSPCVWGSRPTNAFVARRREVAREESVLEALLRTQTQFSVAKIRVPDWYHKSFLSHHKVTGLRRTVDERKDLYSYLGSFISTILRPRLGCTGERENVAIICVTSAEELEKCNDYSTAARARGMWPEIRCSQSESKATCMSNVETNHAHLLVLDGGDVYKAGKYYNLNPIASEVYDNSDASYYAVAVVRSNSNITRMDQLRGLRSCHTGMGRTAGWVMPVGYMASEHLLPPGLHCNHTEAMANFFHGGSCVPGANDTSYNPSRVRSDDLCRHCIGDDKGENRCARNSNERYSGYAGALRCLAESNGDVAFVKHTTVSDYTDGRSQLEWARDLVSLDFKLLCDRGSSEEVTNYQNCNLGKVPSHQVVSGQEISPERRLLLSRLLADSSQSFSTNSDLFRLFRPSQPSDLLFKDSATGLRITRPQDTYEEVLGPRFIEASKIADSKHCKRATP